MTFTHTCGISDELWAKCALYSGKLLFQCYVFLAIKIYIVSGWRYEYNGYTLYKL